MFAGIVGCRGSSVSLVFFSREGFGVGGGIVMSFVDIVV